MKRMHWTLMAAVAAILGGVATPSQGQDVPPDAGALFQKLDKNGDGKLTSDEVPEEQARFFERLVRRGDKNADGALTREEFDQASKPDERPNDPPGAVGGDQGRQDPRERFEMLDRNKDGKVTLDEIPEQFRDRMKPMFDRAGKQELTLEDFTRLAAGGGGGRPGQPMGNPEEIFARLDTNGDGKLTVDEAPERARPMLENLFRRAGKEGNASLTKEEFVKNFQPPMPREGAQRPEGNGRPAEGDRPRDGERRPAAEGDRPREGERRPAAEGDRPRDGERRSMEGRGPAIFRLLDTNHDGHLSKDELAKAGEKFDELDRNHDGQLDPFELIGGPPGPPPGRGTPQREGAGPREGNPPRDGAPRGDAPRDGAPREGVRRESDRPDGARRPDGDAPTRGQRPEAGQPGERGAFFQRLDRDGDGKISKDEAPPAMKERFSMLDTNGDGFISQDEMRAGAQQLGDRERRPEERPEAPKRD